MVQKHTLQPFKITRKISGNYKQNNSRQQDFTQEIFRQYKYIQNNSRQ